MRPQSFAFILAAEHLVTNNQAVIEVHDGCGWVPAEHVNADNFRLYNLSANKVYRQMIKGSGGLAGIGVDTSTASHTREAIEVNYFTTRSITDAELTVLCENTPDLHIKRMMWLGFKTKYLAFKSIDTHLELLTLTYNETQTALCNSRKRQQQTSNS